MPDTSQTTPDINSIMATLRATINTTLLEQSDPEQTLRPRTGAILNRAATVKIEDSSAAVESGRESLARWSEFTIHDRVGKGGMGQIFRAGQKALRREVAIKQIIPERLGTDSTQKTEEAFVSEALVTGYLDHPNIVPVYSLGRDDDGRWFFSMKMVRGMEWRHLLHPERCNDPQMKETAQARNLDIDDPARRTASLEENLRILLSVCNAVAFAHSKNIIHRDLKPENVMVGAFGEVLVMDWGLAVDVSETPPAPGSPDRRVPTRDECGMGGTASYMAPEQLAIDENGCYEGSGLNRWTDVFLLGAILHELLTGLPPYKSETLQQVLLKAATCDQTPLPDVLPQELADICRKALAKNPRERHADALDFQRAVQDFLKHRESALIAAKAGQEAQDQSIRGLSRAVTLYEQALALWPQNAEAKAMASAAQSLLRKKEDSARHTRYGLRTAVVAIVVGLTVGFFSIKSAKDSETAAKKDAETQKGIALQKARDEEQQRLKTEEALVESRHQEGIAWLERAKTKSQFENALMSARAIGFTGFGRPEGDTTFDKSYPQLLKPDSKEWSSAEARAKSLVFRPVWKGKLEWMIDRVAFSPDGTMLAVAHGNMVDILDVASGVSRARLWPKGVVFSIAFSPDGATLATGDFGKAVSIWDVRTGKVKTVLRGHEELVQSVAFSPDGATLASGSGNTGSSKDNSIRLWDLASGTEKARLDGHEEEVLHVAYSPDGGTLFSSSSDKTLRMRDVATNREVSRLQGLNESVASFEISPDGSTLASGHGDGSVRIWDIASGSEQWRFSLSENPLMEITSASVSQLAFSPDGQTLAAGSGNSVQLWNVLTHSSLTQLKGHSMFHTLAYSPDGFTLAIGNTDGSVELWNVEGNVKASLRGPGRVTRWFSNFQGLVAFSLDGSTVVTGSGYRTSGNYDLLQLWDVATGREKSHLFKPKLLDHDQVALSPNGAILATGGKEKALQLWDTATGNERAMLTGHDGRVSELAFSPNGSVLASASDDKTVRLWDVAAGKEIVRLSGHEAPVMHVQFSMDGALLASTSADTTIRIWDIARGKEKLVLKGHDCLVGLIAFSQDASQLASVRAPWQKSKDKAVRVWDLFNGTEKLRLTEHGFEVNHLSFSPDGATLMLSDADRNMQLWDIISRKQVPLSDIKNPTVPAWARTTPTQSFGSLAAHQAGDSAEIEDSAGTYLLADYLKYYDHSRAEPTQGMPYLNVNPYSHISILQSKKPPNEINRLLFWRYYQAKNKNSSSLMLSRMLPGKERDEARDAYDRRFVLEPLRSIGDKQFVEKKWQEAIDTYSKLLSKWPSDEQALLRRAESYAALGNSASELADYNRLSTNSKPFLVRSLVYRGKSNFYSKSFEGAVASFTRALDLDPQCESARLGLLEAAELAKTRESFLSAVQRAASGASSALILNNSAWALLTHKNRDFQDSKTALPLAQKAVEQSHEAEPNYLDTLALALFRNDEKAKAIEIQKKAIALLPKNVTAAVREEFESRLKEFEGLK